MFEPEKLPAPDDMGLFVHPDIPGDEGDNVTDLCKALGFKVAVVSMEDDAPELSDAWHETGDMTAPARWTPTPPGEGWILVAKYDTEDGPYAMFVTPNASFSGGPSGPSAASDGSTATRGQDDE